MRLLLVEDNQRLRELLTESIHGVGWRIDAFGTVGDGQEAAATTPYDLLLIDLGLPDGDGLDLIRDIRRDGVKTPILALTARGAIDERIAGLTPAPTTIWSNRSIMASFLPAAARCCGGRPTPLQSFSSRDA